MRDTAAGMRASAIKASAESQAQGVRAARMATTNDRQRARLRARHPGRFADLC
jgi:hypothetical protein